MMRLLFRGKLFGGILFYGDLFRESPRPDQPPVPVAWAADDTAGWLAAEGG